MKKNILAATAALVLSLATAISADAVSARPVLKKVVYVTSLDCENCARKIRENVSFEKGVKDLKVDVPTKRVEIQFDSNKTDTLKLKSAIIKLGYKASVVEYK